MTPATPARMEGLDVFRGLAVASMIIVNNPGSAAVWWPLDHAAWHGWTPTDLIFPGFLFAVGMALGLGFPRQLGAEQRRSMWKRIAWRGAALVLLGLGFSILARLSFENIRYFGVLQRIGVTYVLAASLILVTAKRESDNRFGINVRVVAMTALLGLALYWALLMLVPVPDHGAGNLSPEGNLAGYIDRTLFAGHIWRHGKDAAGNVVYDPEGLLSTMGALASVLIGALAACLWKREGGNRLMWLAGAGAGLVIAGLALDPLLPINKSLWTSSYVLFSSGVSMLILVACILLSASVMVAPLRVLGKNAILGYCLSLLIGIAGLHAIIPDGAGGFAKLPYWANGHLQALIGNPYVASAGYGLLVMLATLAVLIPLHRHGLFWRL